MKKVIFTFALFLGLCSAFAQNYTWTHMPSLGQTLYAPASFTVGNDIYVVSGIAVSYGITGYPVTMSHEVWDFNTVSNTWSQKANFPGEAIYGGNGFTIGSYGYIVNGWDSTGSGNGPSNTWQYNPATDTWTSKAPFPGSTRYTAATFALNGKGYVACGFKPYTNDMWCYDPTADSWSQKTSFPGSSRQALSFMTLGNLEYAGMGATSDGRGSYFIESDWYSYDGLTDTWTLLNPFPGDAVDAGYSFTINGEGYVVCGLDQSSIYYSNSTAPSNKVWKYLPSSDTWSLWGVFPDSSLFSGAFGSSNGAGYMGFGATNFSTYPYVDKFYRFGPAVGPYSCAAVINTFEISNAVYNFQANGSFSPTAQITWDFGDGHTGTGTSVIHNYPVVGSYTVRATVVDSASSCADSAHTTVSVANINPCSVSANSSGYGNVFNLSAIVTHGAGPYTYQWSCTSDSSYMSSSPDPVVSIPMNIPVTYCVTVTDTSGCVASSCTTVVDSPTFYTPCEIYLVIYPDSAVPGYYYGYIYTQNDSALTFSWTFGDGGTSNLEFPDYTYAVPGKYTICLTVSDGPGCSFTFCDSAFYAYKYGGGPMTHFNVRGAQVLGINDIKGANGISIYPNPVESTITINASGNKIDNAVIYDISGQEVQSTSSVAQNKMDVSTLTDGIYFIDVKVKGVSTRMKFVKAN